MLVFFFFFQAEDGIRDIGVTGVQTCALPISESDVVWVADRERFGREARVAPLSVAGLMRSAVFGTRTTVLTSATLKLGGDFAGIAGSVGLRTADRHDEPDWQPDPAAAAPDSET